MKERCGETKQKKNRIRSVWTDAYRRLFTTVEIVRVATQGSASVQLDVKFVVVTTSPVDVNTERIVGKSLFLSSPVIVVRQYQQIEKGGEER